MKKIGWLVFFGFLLASCNFPSSAVEPGTAGTTSPDTIETTAGASPGPTGIAPALLISPMPIPNGPPVQPVTTHPRLWITAAGLPRLRAWAVDTNPLYQSLAALVGSAKDDMDSGKLSKGDGGTNTWVDDPHEMYAELFAFFSLIDNNEPQRAEYAQRAHQLLMDVIDQAAKGTKAGQPFRDPEFALSDRSRWFGEGFALTVDWIYPSLSKDDKAKIRSVFLNWIDADLHADITTFNHPEPVGVVNDPQLLANRAAVRYSLNNYYTAHMRNIGLMSMALDAGDDPDGKLASYLGNATGAWLYVIDYGLRTDARGGLTAEGFEYSHQSIGYILDFLLALHTAGQDDPRRWGPQVLLQSNPFWDDMLVAYNHSISPAPKILPDVGQVYQPVWYGDGQDYALPDLISAYGPLGIYDQLTGNQTRLNAVRWWEMNIPAGGASALADRVRGQSYFTSAIQYFLLFDPSASAPTDPRQGMPLFFLAPGIGHLFARTSWGPQAAWFQYVLGWNQVDHQDANGNHFGFYRNGEWLTKERMGYADIAEGIASSEFENTLALQNDRPPDRDPSDWRYDLWVRGSQWNIVAAGDPNLIAASDTAQYTYALGDSTNLYNSTNESSTDILHASRSIVWLKPDDIIVYDRATSKTAGRFKRFWLQLPEKAQVSGVNARMQTASGQQLFISSLLPAGAQVQAVNSVDKHITDTATPNDPMKYRLKIEAPGGPQDVRFLTVLQGADPGAAASSGQLVRSSSGTEYEGALVKDTLVLFPVSLAVKFTSLVYATPAGAHLNLITGLAPAGGYDISAQAAGGNVTVTLQPGTHYHADSGGVLAFSLPLAP